MHKRILQLGVLGVLLTVAWQSQAIADWWGVRDYEPPAQIEAIANRLELTNDARQLFYLNRPELNDKDSFNRNCQAVGFDREHANVLGCQQQVGIFNQGRIYLLAVDREELDGIVEVTAAHELLHAAYARLSRRERQNLNALLEIDFDRFASDYLREKLELYGDNPAVRLDEMHSFLGTEVGTLSPALENHYARYFRNRERVVGLYEQYEAVFQRLEAEIAALETELVRLQGEIEALRLEIERSEQELNAIRAEMDEHLAQGRTAAYNALVPAHNSLLATYNSQVDSHNARVATHNRRAERLNDLAFHYSDLAQSLDSRQAVP